MDTVKSFYHQTIDRKNLFLADKGRTSTTGFDPSVQWFQRVSELPESHMVCEYLIKRKIPKRAWSDLWFTENFLAYGKELQRSQLSTVNLVGMSAGVPDTDYRIVMVARSASGDVTALNARRITANPKDKDRYLTLEANPSPDRWCLHGLHTANTKERVWLVEGPIDSLLVKNGVAICGITSTKSRRGELKSMFKNYVVVLDNEPEKTYVANSLRECVESGDQVMVWPSNYPYKDLNEMAQAGMTETEIVEFLNLNTYQGDVALVEWWRWKATAPATVIYSKT